MNARRLLSCLCLSVLCLPATLPAVTLANRVFVSARSGNDANNCANIVTPCQTFAGAVVQLNAGGEAIVLDSGGYGPVTINQSLTIEAPPGVVAFIHPPSGDAITITGGDVILRGLSLNGGTANGINVTGVSTLSVENCIFSGFINDGIQLFTSGQVVVKDSIFRHIDFRAIETGLPSGTLTLVIEHCSFENSLNSAVATFGSTTTMVRDSVISGDLSHGNFGLLANDSSVMIVDNSTIVNNPTGLISSTGAKMDVSNSTIAYNTLGLDLDGGSGAINSRGNNTLRQNSTEGSFSTVFSPQ